MKLLYFSSPNSIAVAIVHREVKEHYLNYFVLLLWRIDDSDHAK